MKVTKAQFRKLLKIRVLINVTSDLLNEFPDEFKAEIAEFDDVKSSLDRAAESSKKLTENVTVIKK